MQRESDLMSSQIKILVNLFPLSDELRMGDGVFPKTAVNAVLEQGVRRVRAVGCTRLQLE